MSDNYDDLGRTLRALLLEEADTMEFDIASASERLERELRPGPRRRGVAVVAVLAAVVVVAAALVVWSGRDANDATPANEPATPSPSTSESPDGAAPPAYFLDLATLDKTLAPEQLAQIAYDSVVLTFSPDGTQVAFGSCRESNLCSKNDEAFLGNVDGAGLQRVEVGDGLNAYPMSWTPDGRLVVVERHGGTYDVGDLFLYDPSTGTSTRITDVGIETANWYAMNAFVSVDGSKVFYSLARPLTSNPPVDAWSVPVSGGESTLLFRNVGEPRDVVDDLADGRVAFRRPPLEVVAATPGGNPQALVDSSGDFLVSPDGTRIAYVEVGPEHDLYVLDVSTGETSDPVASDVDDFWWVGNDRILIQ